jgi:hypothetical protein
MIKFKNTVQQELFDDRNNSLGLQTIRAIINSALFSFGTNDVYPQGFYYWRNLVNQDIVLGSFKSPPFPEATIKTIEAGLPANDPKYIFASVEARSMQFFMAQQQIEDGKNFGTNYQNWTVDLD